MRKKIQRTVAALIWLTIAYATLLSFNSNRDPQWFDWVSVAPTLLLFLLLAFGRDTWLTQELEGWLGRVAPKAKSGSGCGCNANGTTHVGGASTEANADQGSISLSGEREAEDLARGRKPQQHARKE